jgi:hypothetical protein
MIYINNFYEHIQLLGDVKHPDTIAEKYLSEEGLKKRQNFIDVREEEERINRREMEEWERSVEEEKAWQQCLEDEMGYIRNNGGDWIEY